MYPLSLIHISYGACVDLLVAYFGGEAEQAAQ